MRDAKEDPPLLLFPSPIIAGRINGFGDENAETEIGATERAFVALRKNRGPRPRLVGQQGEPGGMAGH